MSATKQQLANAIRFLSIDAVQQANSGHPGMPMGMADIATVLWRDFLNHNPSNPGWLNRDRFVLSNGHGSMLLYALLHLTGYDVSIDDLKNFRQWHSKTPGHPERQDTPGVETTTGPLGQGIANAVGMALAEKKLAQSFNQDGFTMVDHYTYTFLGDGCLMEGVSHEACALAGTWGLSKLIAFWDDNHISIDGDVKGWFTDNTPARFKSYGWQVIENIDGHDQAAIKQAIIDAQANDQQPTLICCRTNIGFGSPNKVNSAGAHGSPLGAEEIKLTREALDWPYAPFEIPEDVASAWSAKEQGAQKEQAWLEQFKAYEKAYPILAEELTRRFLGQMPTGFHEEYDAFIKNCQQQSDTMATRKASLTALNQLVQQLPELLGGSADLSGSNCTKTKADIDYIHYGVREFGMSAIMNGIALHGGFIPYGGTFLVFSDYARNAIRMSALMQQKVVYVMTHDSIGLGEDGPTHQPVEHLASLRIIPGLHVWRPCDVAETAVAWRNAVKYQGPSVLALSRQDLTHQARNDEQLAQIAMGAYVLFEPNNPPKALIIATGSEVELAIAAAKQLEQQGKPTRVVSMPCAEIFKAQDADYKAAVLPADITNRVAIEAGVSDYWYQWVGSQGKVIGIDHFGLSAPAEKLFEAFGFTVQHIINLVRG